MKGLDLNCKQYLINFGKILYLLKVSECQNIQVIGSPESLWFKKWVENFCNFTVNIKYLFNNVL